MGTPCDLLVGIIFGATPSRHIVSEFGNKEILLVPISGVEKNRVIGICCDVSNSCLFLTFLNLSSEIKLTVLVNVQ
jgi:hypothetical protein